MSGSQDALDSDDALKRARAARETLSAQKAQLDLDERRGKLVDRAKVVEHVKAMAGEERDALLRFVTVRSPEMAQDLGVSAGEMEHVLGRYVRLHLEHRAGVRIDVGT